MRSDYSDDDARHATGTLTGVALDGVVGPDYPAAADTTDLVWDRLGAVPRVVDAVNPGDATARYWAGDWAYGLRSDVLDGPLAHDALGTMIRNGADTDEVLRVPDPGPYGEWPDPDPTLGLGLHDELTLADGLVALRARNYDPNTQAFTTRDPHNLTNPYHYADNDPINRQDPLGLRGEQKDPCGQSQWDVGASAIISVFTDDKCFNSGDGGEALLRASPIMLGTAAGVLCGALTAGLAAVGCATAVGAISGAGAGGITCVLDHISCTRPVVTGAIIGGATALLAEGALQLLAPGLSGASAAARTEATTAVQAADDVIKGGVSAGEDDVVDLYRAVGVRELNAVDSSQKFLPSVREALDGRQFATTFDEALAYADTDPSKVAVLKVGD